MSHPVVTVRPHLSARAATALLVSHGFTSAPVVTAEGVVVGIVTEADLLRGQMPPESDPVDPVAETTAREVMTPGVVTMHPDDDLTDVAAVLLDRGLRAVPIVDRGHLVGIVSRRDVLRSIVADEPGAHADLRRVPGRLTVS